MLERGCWLDKGKRKPKIESMFCVQLSSFTKTCELTLEYVFVLDFFVLKEKKQTKNTKNNATTLKIDFSCNRSNRH